jgi:LysM repeat protein
MRTLAAVSLLLTLLLLPWPGNPAQLTYLSAPAYAQVGGPGTIGPPHAGTIHIVQWGDTLYSIANYYGITIEAIMAANGLANPNYIFVGQRLLIPVGGAPPPGPGTVYIVRWGDTLYSIALRFGTTVEALVMANGLPNAWQIYAGQELLIPGPGPGPCPGSGPCPGPGPGPSPLPAEAIFHIVKPGETLTSIAYHYATTVNAIAQANSLYDPSYIYVGQRLIIPSGVATPFGHPTATYYTVMPGDTCAGIALRYGMTPWAIAMANNLANPALIYSGQELVIPTPTTPSPQAAQKPPPLCSGPNPPSECAGPPGMPTAQVPPPLCSGPNPPPECAGPPAIPAAPVPPQYASANKPPIVTREWKGVIISNTSSQTDTLQFTSVLRVVVAGAKNLPVTVTTDEGQFIARGFTGTKPEYGEFAVEFAPFKYGTYRVTPEGLGTSVDVDLDGVGQAFVQFYEGPVSP